MIRTPQQYLRTRIYHEALVEEAIYVLAEWLSSSSIHQSIAFPEIVVGIVVMLRKNLKAAKNSRSAGKEVGSVKALVERVEETAKWMEEKRKGVAFGPGRHEAVGSWEAERSGDIGESPLSKYVKMLRKAKEKKRALMEKVSVWGFCAVHGLANCIRQLGQRRRGRDTGRLTSRTSIIVSS
jgi:nucleolar complex protein 2